MAIDNIPHLERDGALGRVACFVRNGLGDRQRAGGQLVLHLHRGIGAWCCYDRVLVWKNTHVKRDYLI